MNWINIEDQLPPSNKRLAFILEHSLLGTDAKFYWCATGVHYFDIGYWIPAKDNDHNAKQDKVVYWLELPEFPTHISKDEK